MIQGDQNGFTISSQGGRFAISEKADAHRNDLVFNIYPRDLVISPQQPANMVYKMNFHVDGGCRRNGQHYNVIGAAAAVWKGRYSDKYRTRALPPAGYYYSPEPTNQRAELTAVIMALEWALERYSQLNGCPRARVRIYSDSQYAVNCMTMWIYNWANNGWQSARGCEVANRDLMEWATALDVEVRKLGSLRYVWVPRRQNRFADQYCNERLNEMEGYY
ncbi:ribonuclease H1 [Apiospora saccharicola]|uniref:ribonuclease H n=1 Tax=Apiospora saccharicola TaxID=335842 RepID=A0ABR1W585_9PEZI